MIVEARRVLGERGVAPDRVWEGSVLEPFAFRPCPSGAYDAVVCVGVLPHVPSDADLKVIDNLRRAVRQNGLVIVEARNALFSFFTLNRPTCEFFLEQLLPTSRLTGPMRELVRRRLTERFLMDLPPVRKGRSGEPGYDEVLSRAHNPLVLKEQFFAQGFRDVRLLFYHY
jgi:hypothetical protein